MRGVLCGIGSLCRAEDAESGNGQNGTEDGFFHDCFSFHNTWGHPLAVNCEP